MWPEFGVKLNIFGNFKVLNVKNISGKVVKTSFFMKSLNIINFYLIKILKTDKSQKF